MKAGNARRIDKPGQFFSRIHVADIASAVVKAMTRNEPGGIYNLADDLPSPNSEVIAYAFELLSHDVVGDMAWTAGLEHTSASVDGQPRTYTLRATQVYRREAGEWRVAHRHADTVNE